VLVVSAPSNTTPAVTCFQKLISNFRAKATTSAFRTPPPLSCVRYETIESVSNGADALSTTRRVGSWLFAAAGFRLWRCLVRARRIRSRRASAPIRHMRQPAVGWKSCGTPPRPQDTGEFPSQSPFKFFNIASGAAAFELNRRTYLHCLPRYAVTNSERSNSDQPPRSTCLTTRPSDIT
jgi:hypothetical protein